MYLGIEESPPDWAAHGRLQDITPRRTDSTEKDRITVLFVRISEEYRSVK
jgi:hypothetical protein